MNSDKSSEVVKMSIAIEMKQAIVVVAGPRGWTDTRESWLSRAARRAGISYRQAKSLFYRESPDPKSSVVDRVRGAALRQAKSEAAELANRFETIAGGLDAAGDPDFYRAHITALRDIADTLRGLDRARDGAEDQTTDTTKPSKPR